MDAPRVIIIAGPNGAGKTTFARSFLPNEGDCTNFINADLIAAGLAPFHPELAAAQAGRLMLGGIARYVAERESFAFETTLSGRSYSRQIPQWRKAGFRVSLLFLKLPSVRLALSRVKSRVTQGGHDVPSDVVRRRFRQGWLNFETLYCPLVTDWQLYENSGPSPILLDAGDNL